MIKYLKMKYQAKYTLLGLAGLIMVSYAYFRPKTKETNLPKLNEVNLTSYTPAYFVPEESYMPYYLKHISEIANSVLDSGPNKGFINISVWRPKEVNQPYNARIMENIMSLVWFFTQQRPWNPYYNDQALKVRIEAALTYWCNIQNTDGRFSEYGPNEWFLAPTAFATKFVGRALYLLDAGPKIDDKVYMRAVKSWRKALYIGFTDQGFWNHGRNFTNQYANFWGGALMYLKKWPDAEIEQLFRKRLQESMTEFQSPCGFFYEEGGPDWGYNLYTHHSDLHVAYDFSKGTDLQDVFVEQTRRWYDWFSYNAILEPGTKCFYLNRAIETRQHKSFYEAEVGNLSGQKWVPQAEFVENARAFQLSKEELKNAQQKSYHSMVESYPKVAPLVQGSFWAYTPYAFVHVGMVMWQPTQEQKDEAIRNLPYLMKDRFTQVRYDPRSNTAYTFYKKPKYYAIFNSGKIIVKKFQRFGLGLIWSPEMGTIFQSQSCSDEAAFGTKAASASQTYEAQDLFPEIRADDKILNVVGNQQDLSAESLSFSYPLGGFGKKTIQMVEDKIAVSVKHSGSFTEILPLIVWATDVLTFDNSSIVLKNAKGKTCTIKLNNATEVKKKPVKSDLKYKDCVVFEIKASGKLDYEIVF
jgi:hypothetical protein